MAASVECIPGPHWTCVGGKADAAQFVFDVDPAIARADVERGNQFEFEACGENRPGLSSRDPGIHFYVSVTAPYSPKPACP